MARKSGVIRPEIYEVIVTAARQHRVTVNAALYARCEYELERSGEDKESIVQALLRAFNWHREQQDGQKTVS